MTNDPPPSSPSVAGPRAGPARVARSAGGPGGSRSSLRWSIPWGWSVPTTRSTWPTRCSAPCLAVVHQRAGDAGVDRVLERCGERRSAADLQRPDGWSTYEQGLALFHAAAETLGDPDVGRKAGMEVFRRYAGTEVLALLRSIGSPAEMIRVYPAISAKQSTITRWKSWRSPRRTA